MYVCLSVYLLLLVYDRRRAQTGTDFESNWHLKFFETNCKKNSSCQREKKPTHKLTDGANVVPMIEVLTNSFLSGQKMEI